MLNIDGSIGEGGGQVLRTALGLSMVTGRGFRIEKIRAGRKKSGLLRQHLTAVKAAVAICGATAEGAALGSNALTFEPGAVRAGNYTFSIGTAGSTTLVLQTVLPALLGAGGASTLTLEGGTHNPFAPPIDFLEKAFLPLVNRMGPTVSATLERAGFYPGGGGRVTVKIEPAALRPLHVRERGEIRRKLAKAVVAALPGEIARRELERVTARLGWSGDQLQILQLPREQGPGNLLTLELESEQTTEVFTGFGLKGTTAEAAADEAIDAARDYLAGGAPIGPHLADQLLVPIALGGGSFRTTSLTRHAVTNIEIIQKFLPVRFRAERETGTGWDVSVDGV